MILFCLGKYSKKYQYFQDTKMIAVSVLNSNQKKLSNNFSRNHDNYWDGIDLILGKQSKCPIIKDSLSFLECIIEAKYDGGDHTIFTAKVINHGKSNDLSPLIHFRSSYWELKD
jgi:flavin reductase (DIM6/NTAB) family NADH-FMN oxidoreductase RutF